MSQDYLGPVADAPWNAARWPHFTAHEIACPCCGEVYIWPAFLDAMERLRQRVGRPIIINSGHRCAIHNALVGGAPLSQHKTLAIDVRLAGHDPRTLALEAARSGFTGFGFGNTFLHLDGRARPGHWFYGQRSIAKWTSVISWTQVCRAASSA